MVVENLDSEKMTWRENDVTCNAISLPENLRIFVTFAKKLYSNSCQIRTGTFGAKFPTKVFFSNSKSDPVLFGSCAISY